MENNLREQLLALTDVVWDIALMMPDDAKSTREISNRLRDIYDNLKHPKNESN